MINPVKIDRPLEEITRFNKDYWGTYMHQAGVSQYSEKTILEDSLYAVAASLSEEYTGASGFDQFKKDLVNYLNTQKTQD